MKLIFIDLWIEVIYIIDNLELYKVFYYTAQTGTLTHAAEKLFITQPSVSYAIKQLEKQAGMKLFRRMSKGVELTEEGKELYETVSRAFAILEEGEKRLRDLKRLVAGEIRIGASDSLFKHVLLPRLESFYRLYPDIRIRLSHGKTPDIVSRLKDGQIDCGIVHLPVDDEEAFDITELDLVQDIFIAGAKYRELAERQVSLRELASTYPLLTLSAGSTSRRFLDKLLAGEGAAATPDIEAGSVDLLIELARIGLGIAFIGQSYAKRELEAGTLFEIRVAEPIPPRQIGVVLRKGASLSIAADRFLQELINGFSHN